MSDHVKKDPLCLPALAVDKILNFLDDGSLINGRLVSLSWNDHITSRTKMWKKRCQDKRVLRIDLSLVPKEDYFQEYLRYQRVYHRMLSGCAFEVDRLLRFQDCVRGVSTDSSLVPVADIGKDLSNDFWGVFHDAVAVDTTPPGNLVLVWTMMSTLALMNVADKTEVWEVEDVEKWYFQPQSAKVYISVSSGGILEVSLEGVENMCTHSQYNPDEVEMVWGMAAHPSSEMMACTFGDTGETLALLDWRPNGNGWTVLDITFPEVPEDCLEEGEEEEDCIDDEVHILPDVTLRNGKLGNSVWVCKHHLLLVFTVDESREIVSQDTKVFRRLHSVHREDRNRAPQDFVIEVGRNLEKYCVRCDVDGVHLDLVWRKALPGPLTQLGQSLSGVSRKVLFCGDHFLLARKDLSLLILRLDDGRVATSFPGFFTELQENETPWQEAVLTGQDLLKEMVVRREHMRSYRHPDSVVLLTNTSWLQGLSPASTSPNLPVAMLMTRPHTDLVTSCLRWNGAVWRDAD